MPTNALLSGRDVRTPRDLVAAAILVYAVEHCIPAEVLAFLDERLEELAATAAPQDQLRLLLVQHELERPLSGISTADATRLHVLRVTLQNIACSSAERVAAIIEEIEQRELATAALPASREDDLFAHRPDGEWESIEKAAYEGALRFPPARHLAALAVCVEHAARKVARWERQLRAQGTTDIPIETLRKVARKAGKQCAMDAWRSNQRALSSSNELYEHYDSTTLSSLLALAKQLPIDYQVLLLGELAFGPRMRGQQAPHRSWLGLTEANYRVRLMRARDKLALALSVSPRPRGDRRDLLESLAPASLELAAAALAAQTEFWHDHDGDDGQRRRSERPYPEVTEQMSQANNSSPDAGYSSVLAMILRDVIDKGAPLPEALFIAASAGQLDEPATHLLDEHDPARTARARAMLGTIARRRRADAVRPTGTVAVKLFEGARRFVIECMGGAALPGISLSDSPSPAITQREDRAELVFPDKSEVHLIIRSTPERPRSIDIAVERVPALVTSLGMNVEGGDRAEELTIDATRLRLGLASPVFRSIPVGRHRLWASVEDGRTLTWLLCVEPA